MESHASTRLIRLPGMRRDNSACILERWQTKPNPRAGHKRPDTLNETRNDISISFTTWIFVFIHLFHKNSEKKTALTTVIQNYLKITDHWQMVDIDLGQSKKKNFHQSDPRPCRPAFAPQRTLTRE